MRLLSVLLWLWLHCSISIVGAVTVTGHHLRTVRSRPSKQRTRSAPKSKSKLTKGSKYSKGYPSDHDSDHNDPDPVEPEEAPDEDGDHPLDVESDGFEKCFSNLQSVAINNNVYQQQYLDFLRMMTNGSLDYATFTDLPEDLQATFYSAACAQGQDCASMPCIYVSDQYPALWTLQEFCQAILTEINTTARVRFEFSIRYDSNVIDPERITTCLSTATENLLLVHFGCQIQAIASGNIHRHHRSLLDRIATSHSYPLVSRKSRELRLHQSSVSQLNSFDSWSKNCPYTVDVTITILSLPCIPPDLNNTATRCGLAQSTVDVTVPQIVQPFEAVLYDEVITTLRQAIDTGSLESYFPPDCQVQA